MGLDDLEAQRVRFKKGNKRGERIGNKIVDWADESGVNYNEVAWSTVEEVHEDIADLL